MEKWNTRLHLERKQEVEPSGSMSTVTLPAGKHRDRFLPSYPFPRGYHPGHWPLVSEVKGVGVSPSFGFKL
jgi:hypothetical protein